jgi:F0F1-type ATP synthase assembly protein I
MNLEEVLSAIQSDASLTSDQKNEITKAENRKKLESLFSGVAGAGLGLALAKYYKMSKTAQVMLAALGFGAGTLLYKYMTRERFATYDASIGTNRIDSRRF